MIQPRVSHMIKIRKETGQDVPAIRTVNEKAFGQSNEADIIEQLRKSCAPFLSLVAEQNDQIIGHILFTPVTIETDKGTYQGMGLAPMAVLPEHQNKGIGSSLINEGLKAIRSSGTAFVVVLGHPNYYPKFGFEPSSKYAIRCEWEVPEEAFMVLFFDPSKAKDICGIAKYRSEFADAM